MHSVSYAPNLASTNSLGPVLMGQPMAVDSPHPSLVESGSYYNSNGNPTHYGHTLIPTTELPPNVPIPQDMNSGPQGDPFPPQSESSTIVPESKPVERKRNWHKHTTCYTCKGTEHANKKGEWEALRSCEACGRAVHPSCLDLDSDLLLIFRYKWTCNVCKTCDICDSGDAEGMLFCDHCDRGFHSFCLTPPLTEVPDGKWHCHQCPQLIPSPPPPPSPPPLLAHPEYPASAVPDLDVVMMDEEIIPETPLDEDGQPIDTEILSSSPELQRRTHGRRAPVVVVSSEDDEDEEENNDDDSGDTSSAIIPRIKISKIKGKTKSYKSRKRPPAPSTSATPARPPKRSKMPPPPTPTSPIRRIKLTMGRATRQREEEEARKGMFDDILNDEDRDVSKTGIITMDKNMFAGARQVAEARVNSTHKSIDDDLDISMAGPSSRPTRSQMHSSLYIQTLFRDSPGRLDSPSPSTPGPSSEKGTEKAAPDSEEKKPLRIQQIRFGEYNINTWFDAPFPEEYNNLPDGRMWICEFCLKYMKSDFSELRHRTKCKCLHPPGDEIYRDGTISVFEIDGRKNKIYCQNLCLLSKMFLDHKSLFYDVEPFLFYVMTETDDDGAHFIGYFSKEKRSPNNYNVSCIMTLPVRQRRGWGNLLIDFSYLLSKKEQRTGSPEKPLSDLGALSYRKYWTLSLMRYFATPNVPDHPRLEDISVATSMTTEDVCTTLQHLQLIQVVEDPSTPIKPLPGQSFKHPRGRKSIAMSRRSSQRHSRADSMSAGRPSPAPTDPPPDPHKPIPFVAPERYVVACSSERAQQWLRNWDTKNYVRLRPDKLRWSPFLVANIPKSDGPASLPVADAAHTALATPGELENADIVVDVPGPALAALPEVTGGKVPRVATPVTTSVEPDVPHAFNKAETPPNEAKSPDPVEEHIPIHAPKPVRSSSRRSPRPKRSGVTPAASPYPSTPVQAATLPRRSSRRGGDSAAGTPEVMHSNGPKLNAVEFDVAGTLLAMKVTPSPTKRVFERRKPSAVVPLKQPARISPLVNGTALHASDGLGDEDAEGEPEDMDAEGEDEEL